MWEGDVWVSRGGYVWSGAAVLPPVSGGGGTFWGGLTIRPGD